MKPPVWAAPLIRQWSTYAAAYLARQRRERMIIAVAIIALVYAVVDAVLLAPALRDMKMNREAMEKAERELQTYQQQLQALSGAAEVRIALNKRVMAETQAESERVLETLKAFDRALVQPAQMASFLRQLIGANRLELVDFKTLPVTQLVERSSLTDKSDKTEKTDKTDKAVGAAVSKDGSVTGKAETPDAARSAPNLYKHGVEFTVAGSYPALQQYLQQLEASPQKVLWGRMELKAEKYPRSRLTLVLYTLSLESTWLQL